MDFFAQKRFKTHDFTVFLYNYTLYQLLMHFQVVICLLSILTSGIIHKN